MSEQYQLQWLGEFRCWAVTHTDRGVVGQLQTNGDRFRAQVADGDKWVPIGYSASLKSVTEQLIWYDRAMNQEAE